MSSQGRDFAQRAQELKLRADEFLRSIDQQEVLMSHDDIEELLRRANERFAAMTPLEKAIMALEQRRSWVTAEMRMNDDASPNGKTQAQAETALRAVAPEYLVLDELYRLRQAVDGLEAEVESLRVVL